MNYSLWTITVLYLSALCGTVPRAHAENIVDLSKKAIDEVNNAMSLYHKALTVLPWAELKFSIATLEHRSDEFSEAAGNILTEIANLMAKVYYLESYVKLFGNINASNIQKQKDVLVKVLEEGLRTMQAAQKLIGASSSSFNGAAGRLTALQAQLSSDFNSNSAYFKDQMRKRRLEGYGAAAIFGPLAWAIAAGIIEGKLVPELNAKLKQAGNFHADIDKMVAAAAAGIEKTKTGLQNEIAIIGKLKIATEETNTFVSIDYVTDLRDTVIQSANNLIAKCNEYARYFEAVLY